MLSAAVEVDRRDFLVRAELAVAPGERLALFGPSGAGKTTILEAIAGLVRPRRAQITLGGRVLTSTAPPRADVPPWRRRVGLLRQDPGLFPHLPVRANLAYGAGFRPPRPGARRAGRPAGHRGPARRDAGPAVRRPAAPGRARPPAAGPVRRSAPGRAVRGARRQPPPRPHRPGPDPGCGPPGPVRAGGPRAGGGAGFRRPAGGPGPRRDPAGRRARRGGPPPGLKAGRRTGRLPGLRPGHGIPQAGPVRRSRSSRIGYGRPRGG